MHASVTVKLFERQGHIGSVVLVMGWLNLYRIRKALVLTTLSIGLMLCPAFAYEVDHKISYEGAPDGFEAKLNIISTLKKKNKIFPTRVSLRRAARIDRGAFAQALKSAGYYDAKVSFKLSGETTERVSVIFTINDGGLFTVSKHIIIYEDKETEGRPTEFSVLETPPTARADGASIQKNQQTFLQYLWENGYPRATIIGRRAIADFDKKTTQVRYTFKSGPRAKLGEMRIMGDLKTREDYILKFMNWQQGDLYKKSKLLTLRTSLSDSSQFDKIDIAPGETAADGLTPILVTLTERKQRTIGAGVSFSTSEGPGVRSFFENRNLFKRGEIFRLDARANIRSQSLAAQLTKPLLDLPGSIYFQANFLNETTDAFNARTFDVEAGVSKYWLDKRLELNGGLVLETTSVVPAAGGEEDRNYFVSTPVTLLWNNENNTLDPTRGVRASLQVTPTAGSLTFTQIESRVRTRIEFLSNKRLITAFRGRLGGTVGSSFADLPLNKRFFSGGGGSVRGFGFQLAGPVDIVPDDDGEDFSVVPIGGRSVIEGAFETRYSFTKQIQGAAFIDSASIAQSELPDFSQPFFVSVGVGARYFTPVGPLRIDFSVPLNRRPSDRRLQFLISIGQAF